jgi:hypothetical protein
MRKKYYKVLSVGRNGELLSARCRLPGYYTVPYKVNEWTTAPDNTRLFVFDNFDDAKRFSTYYEVIYECEIIGGIEGFGLSDFTKIKEFWEIINTELKKKKKIDFVQIMIDNNLRWSTFDAVLAKKVKLIKKVKRV